MSSKDSKGMYGFDPSGLERAAAVIKFINKHKRLLNFWIHQIMQRMHLT